MKTGCNKLLSSLLYISLEGSLNRQLKVKEKLKYRSKILYLDRNIFSMVYLFIHCQYSCITNILFTPSSNC